MTTAPTAPSLAQVSLGDFAQELAITRRVLERVPDEHWDWKPHSKSMTLGQLSTHVVNLLLWEQPIFGASEMNLAVRPPAPPTHASRASVLAAYDAAAGQVRAAVAGATDQTLSGTYTLRRGEQVMMAMPRAAMLRAFILSHMIHHRGQLSVYLRLLDVPVPSIYGPTADESNF